MLQELSCYVSWVMHVKRFCANMNNIYYYYEKNKPGPDGRPKLFSSARSRLTSRVPPCCASLVRSIHRLISALLPVGRPFGMSRPNTLACGLRKRPGSFLIGSHYRDSQYYNRRWEEGDETSISPGRDRDLPPRYGHPISITLVFHPATFVHL